MAQSSIRNLNIDGNLVISGSTTQLDVSTVVVDDNNITINDVTTPTDANANQGGITLKGATNKTINWVDLNDAWTLSEHLDIATGKEYRINNVSVLNATTLGSSVVNSSLTSIGTLTDLIVGGVKITGASNNIGLLTDTNLITLANNTVTVSGAVHATTFHGDGNALTNLNTASFVAPGNDGDVIVSSGSAFAAQNLVLVTQGGTGGDTAATARTNLGVTATGADTNYNFRANNLSDVTNIGTSRTNLALGTGDSPTFGNTAGGHGAVTIEAKPDGVTLKTAGLLQRSLPPVAGSGHRFFTGIGDGIGSYLISHKVTSDAGVDSGTASVYFWTRDTGKKVYVGGTYPSATTTNAYINDLAYPIADGSAGQIIKTDGAGVLSFANVSSLGTLLASNNLSDVASAATARTNLGLGTAAVQNTGVFVQVANNLSDVTAATARTNLGITATGADTAYAFRANNLSDLANAATARTNLGITATGADTAYAFRANNLSDLANAATARTNLGLANTTNIAEGTNLYYTDARADLRVDAGFAAKSTTNLSEGTNLYYTDVRADARIVNAGSANWNTAYTDTNAATESESNNTLVKRGATGNIEASKVTANNGVILGDMPSAATGGIQWTGTDFQGYNGSAWVSLTSAATASISGQIANFTATQAITSVTYVDIPGYTTAITVTNSNIINVQVNVDLDGPESNNHSFVQLVRVVGGTPTVLYEDESGSSAAGEGDHFNTSYADAHGQSNGTVITYKLMARVSGGTLSVNPNASNAQIFVYEITTTPTAVTSVFGQTGDVISADYGSVA